MEAVEMRWVDPKTPERQGILRKKGADLGKGEAAFAHMGGQIAELAGTIEIRAQLELSAELLGRPVQQHAPKLAQGTLVAVGPWKGRIGFELGDKAPRRGAVEPDKKLAPGRQAVDERAPTCKRVSHVMQYPQALDDVKATGNTRHRRQALNVALLELDIAGVVALRHLARVSQGAGGEVHGLN